MKSIHSWLSLRFVLFAVLSFAGFNCLSQDAQVPTDSICPPKDISDVIRNALHKPPKVKTDDASSLLLVPIIGSNPATGFMFGVGGQFAFKMRESERFSLISGSLQATTKNQFLFLVKNNIYSRRERIFYTGDWRFLIFSQSTYGLGTNSPEGGILDYQYNLGGLETSSDSLTQPMKFNFARFHQSMNFKIAEGIYLGLGYQYDSYFDIVDEKLRLNPGDSLITAHYAYSKFYGFDLDRYYSSAINASFIIDTRDNMIMPYKGMLLSVGWRGALKVVGNKTNANMFQAEWRSFHSLSIRNRAHLIGFWALVNLTPEGDFPYMILPATAYDQRSRSSRGYTQGRFRGNEYVYTEAEYRFPISKCGGLFSGVLFVNGTTANNTLQNLKLFESIKPGYGLGLRIMLDKYSRSNLALDVAFGEKSSGFYLAVSETF